jgi:hypothetical protein
MTMSHRGICGNLEKEENEMSFDKEKWHTMQAKRSTAEVELRVASDALKKLAATAFQESLRKGKWVLSYDSTLTPADGAAEDALHEVLAIALNLGYHDSFSICDGVITPDGYTNDGAVTLHMYTSRKGEVEDEFKRLQLDVDLTTFLHNHLYKESRAARSAAMTAQARLRAAEKALADLGLPPFETEECE